MLLLTLVVLVIVTSSTLGLLNLGVLEGKMYTTERDVQLAFQAAESARRFAENQVHDREEFVLIEFKTDCTSGYCRRNPDDDAHYLRSMLVEKKYKKVWEDGRHQVFTDYHGPQVIENPKYVIEEVSLPAHMTFGDDLVMGFPHDNTMNFYRVTARGKGMREETAVFVQSAIWR